MKRFTLPIVPIFLFFFGYSQNPQLHQGVSFTFDNNNLVPPGNNIYEAVEFNLFKSGSEYVPYSGASLTARINPYLIFPPPDDSLGGPNPGDDGMVGTLSGSLSVTPMGSASYTIPLDLPPGIAGMQPNLSLNYNSLGGNGIMGIGWSIGGLSSITRIGTDIYHEGFSDPVDFDPFDRFALDGSRLVVINGLNNGADGAEYRTEIQSFAKILSYGVAGNGPQYFKVWTKDEKIIEYGNSSDSRIEAPGKSDIYTWLVSKISDRFGNSITFEYYENADMTFCPYKIKYTQNLTQNPNISSFYEVEFHYESRPDSVTQYIAGSRINTWLRLNSITIKYLPTSANYKTYTLKYTKDAGSPITAITDYYSHLESVEVSSDGGGHLNPTTFKWGNVNQTPFELYKASPPTNCNTDFYQGDFNGDGKSDLLKVLWRLLENNKRFYDKFEIHLVLS